MIQTMAIPPRQSPYCQVLRPSLVPTLLQLLSSPSLMQQPCFASYCHLDFDTSLIPGESCHRSQNHSHPGTFGPPSLFVIVSLPTSIPLRAPHIYHVILQYPLWLSRRVP